MNRSSAQYINWDFLYWNTCPFKENTTGPFDLQVRHSVQGKWINAAWTNTVLPSFQLPKNCFYETAGVKTRASTFSPVRYRKGAPYLPRRLEAQGSPLGISWRWRVFSSVHASSLKTWCSVKRRGVQINVTPPAQGPNCPRGIFSFQVPGCGFLILGFVKVFWVRM